MGKQGSVGGVFYDQYYMPIGLDSRMLDLGCRKFEERFGQLRIYPPMIAAGEIVAITNMAENEKRGRTSTL